MLSSWTRPLFLRLTVLAGACLVIGSGVWLASGSFGQNPLILASLSDSGVPAKNPIVAVVDPGPAPKDDAKAEPISDTPKAASPAATEPKWISLQEAIRLVEQSGKGEVVKGEKSGTGASAQFSLEVLTKSGAKTAFNLNATGKVIVETPAASAQKGTKKKGEAEGTSARKKSGGKSTEPSREGREREDRPKEKREDGGASREPAESPRIGSRQGKEKRDD